jgi:oxidase EvaA
MKELNKFKSSFFNSSQELNNSFQSFDDFLSWFDQKGKNYFSVEEVPFDSLDQWYFSENKDSLVHQTGKFFKIEGIKVRTNFGNINEWEQPIINQPEIGILGILTKVIDGVRYFLMQVKMEPGNVNILQLSPTVQATKSNFSRVHKGKIPSYLEYFINTENSRILIDQLQSEQGGRFLRKRNRNMVVEVTDEIEVLEDFCWLTLGEIKKLLRIDNFVNMDARSVISTIPLVDDCIIDQIQHRNLDDETEIVIKNKVYKGVNYDLLISAATQISSISSKDQIISWYTGMKVNYELSTTKIPLSDVKDWKISDTDISYSDRFFSVVGVKVNAGTREVTSWTQPLIKDKNIGLLGFIAKKMDGILHFLVQAKVEPGNLDVIELSPTVSCSNYDYLIQNPNNRPPLFDFFCETNDAVKILINALQSEEGGRFYQMQNRNMIILLDESVELDIPHNYCWMTLNQMMDFMRYSMFNIEARSLISSIEFNNE